MSKLIVTHVSPDFDGIPAIWLLKKFHPDFRDAKVELVPAGSTYNNQPADSDPDIVHVDTGMGRFDHHQSDDFTCAAQLVYEFLIKEGYVGAGDEALGRMIRIITELDHGYDNYKWEDTKNDRYEFMLPNVLVGFKMLYTKDDNKHIEMTIDGLEAVYRVMQSKVKAEKEIEKGKRFKTRWGEGVAILTNNQSVLDQAIKMGYAVVVTKDPVRGNVRATGSNNFNVDLTPVYEKLKARDPEATWFLHASKVLLRNGSTRNPTMKPTKLDLDEIIEVMEKA